MPKKVGGEANSVDPDEVLHSVVSHLGLLCLVLSVRIHKVKYNLW